MAMPFDTGNYGLYLQGYNQAMGQLTGYNYNPTPNTNQLSVALSAGNVRTDAQSGGTKVSMQAANYDPFACIGEALRGYEMRYGKSAIPNLNVGEALFRANYGGTMSGVLIGASDSFPGSNVFPIAGNLMIPDAIKHSFAGLYNQPQLNAGINLSPKPLGASGVGETNPDAQINAPAVSEAEAAARAKAAALAKAEADKEAAPEEKAKSYLEYFTNEENKKKIEAILSDKDKVAEFAKLKETIEGLSGQLRNSQSSFNREKVAEDLRTALDVVFSDDVNAAAFEMYYDDGNLGIFRETLLAKELHDVEIGAYLQNYMGQLCNKNLFATKEISPYGAASEMQYINKYDSLRTNKSLLNCLIFINKKVDSEKEYFNMVQKILNTTPEKLEMSHIVAQEKIESGFFGSLTSKEDMELELIDIIKKSK